MQRVAQAFAFVYLALATVGCMDQGHQAQAFTALDAARREAARDARLQTLEREHAFLMQQVATMTASNQLAMIQSSSHEEGRDKQLADLSAQVGAMSQTIAAWRQEERLQPIDPDSQRMADEGTPKERNAAIRKVQALLDTGRLMISTRGGRIQLVAVRPSETARPQESPLPKPAASSPPASSPPKRPIDRLGF